MRTHRGLLHNVVRGSTTRQVSSTDRIALLFSYSFSAAIGNVFTSLLNGATLLPFNLKEQGAAALADWLIDREITQFHTVPTVFRHFLDSLSTDRIFPQLRLIQLGGETMVDPGGDVPPCDIRVMLRSRRVRWCVEEGESTSPLREVLLRAANDQSARQVATIRLPLDAGRKWLSAFS